MTQLYLVALFITALGGFIYYVLPQARRRVLGVGIFILLALVAYGGTFEILGAAKPYFLEWRELNGKKVIGAHWIEGEAIWIWLLVDGEPKQYKLPWSQREAEQAQKSRRKSKENGGEMIFSDREGKEGERGIVVNEIELPAKDSD
jgi:hypothetical protein